MVIIFIIEQITDHNLFIRDGEFINTVQIEVVRL